TVDRMMSDPVKGNRLVENFAGQWLGIRKLPSHVSGDPDWSAAVATSMAKEMSLYFAEFVKADRPWNEFMKADMNFVDAGSAKLYGMSGMSGRPAGDLARVETKDDKRYGFAGLGGFLAMSSFGERTSPTLRGRWLVATLLCIEPPPPPDNVTDLEATGLDPDKNVRAALEDHRTDPSCAGCHSIFDPYGLSLEHFDRVGKYRTAYSDGTKIDASAELLASDVFPQGMKFSGLDGLTDVMTKHKHFTECVGENLFMYSLGREVALTDRPYLHNVETQWKQGTLSLRRLIQGLVLAETFRFRRASH
ncbi:MAG TPA: DUF1588 domain-containing protein, partial [Polyangia bacterium]